MSDKKSYMNQSNLITEGFFDKLKTLLGVDSKKTKILKKDKKINQNLINLNKSWSNIEKHIAKQKQALVQKQTLIQKQIFKPKQILI